MRLFSRRLGGGLAVVALLGVGYFLGQLGTPPLAAQPGKGVVTASASAPVTPAVPTDKRVIAYVFGNTPITREEYGEYLIQQYGADRVRLYVNRRIIEIAAAKRNVIVTPQEVEAVIAQDCGKLGVNRADFVANVLQQKYGKTLQEWRDDVIRPRLILQQMCRDQIKFEEADVKKVFENLYGEKVKCKIILWPSGNEASELQAALKRYASIRKDEKEFDDAARSQLNSDLAARGGVVDPIGRHSGPGTATFTDSTKANTTVSFDAPGAYTLMLSADDGVHTVTLTAL